MPRTLAALLLALSLIACDQVEQPYESVQDGGGGSGDAVVRKVLLEDMTGHRCNNCPAAAAQATALQAIHGEDLVVIAVHCVNGFSAPQNPIGDGILDSDHRTPEGTAYESAFGITFLPTGLISRRPYNSVYLSWYAARAVADLDDVRIHDLRHTFASLLINKGVSIYEVQQLLGHSSVQMTQRYAHLTPNTLADRAEIVANIVS